MGTVEGFRVTPYFFSQSNCTSRPHEPICMMVEKLIDREYYVLVTTWTGDGYLFVPVVLTF